MVLPLAAFILLFSYRYYHRQHDHFMTAVKYGESIKVRSYLNWYANPNYLDSNGNTPLSLAIKQNHKEVITLLIRNGANLETPDASGTTPVQLAQKLGNKELVDLLIRHGAQPA